MEAIDRLARGTTDLALVLRKSQAEGGLMDNDLGQQLLSWSKRCNGHREREQQTRGDSENERG
jgi:hypothetical protein